eukprot:1732663-Pleurochrysis_carterae.AAC.2
MSLDVLRASASTYMFWGCLITECPRVAVVYLRSRTQQGCDSFLGCAIPVQVVKHATHAVEGCAMHALFASHSVLACFHTLLADIHATAIMHVVAALVPSLLAALVSFLAGASCSLNAGASCSFNAGAS